MYNINAAILSVLNLKRFTRKHKLEKLRSIWGLPLERIPNFDLIKYYHELVCKDSGDDYVDDKTWADLNLNDVYSLIDRNISGPGRQYLYHLLHKYEQNDDLLKRYQQINLFKENQAVREKIQLALLRIRSDDTYFIISLLLGEKPVIPKYPLLIYLSSALSVLSILAAFYNSTFFFAVLFMSVLNLIITKTYSSGIAESFIGFSNLKKLIVSAYELSNMVTESEIEQLSFLKSIQEF